MEKLYEPRELAGIYGIGYRTVLRWIGEGKLPARQLPSGAYRVRETDIEKVLTPVGADRA